MTTRSFIIGIGFIFTTACASPAQDETVKDYTITLEDLEGLAYSDPYDTGWYAIFSRGEYTEYAEGLCSVLSDGYVVTFEDENLGEEIGNSQATVLKIEGEETTFWMVVGGSMLDVVVFYTYPTREGYVEGGDDTDRWFRYEGELCQ